VGVFGKPVALEDGRTLTADENYLRQCILNSAGQVVKGFPPIMPVFQGQLSEEQVNALVAYVKSLSGPQPGQTTKADSAASVQEPKVQ
jgi:cytochrome c oxidase subunit II